MTSLPNYLEQQAYLYRLNKARLKTTPVDYWDNLYILDKSDKLIPFHLNPVQQQYRANRTGRDLIVKARQQGLSTFIQADHFVNAIGSTARIATLAHDDQTTQKLRRMAARFWDNLPANIRPPRGLDNATTTTYPQTKSEVTITTAGSKNAGRGGTYRRIHGSEVAFWKDADYVMAGIMQGVPDDGTIELESTANGAQGWFYERCMEALDGNALWRLHFFPWWLSAEYALPLAVDETLTLEDDEAALAAKHGLTLEQIKWRRRKIKELTPALFAQEYPEDVTSAFLSSGNSVFGDIRHALYTPDTDKPVEGHYHIAALDFGQENDYTALSILDADDNREVYLNRWRQLPWKDIRTKVLDACQHWRVNALYPEKNSASSNIENLVNEAAERGLRMDIIPYVMTNDRKASMVGTFYTAIHESDYKILDIDYATAELRAFTSKQSPTGAWTYAAQEPAHDDTVIARIAAKWGAARRGN